MPSKAFTLVSESITRMDDAPVVFVAVFRQRRADTLEVGCFVVHTGCLGIKDAWYETNEPELAEFKEHYFRDGYLEKSAAWGRHFVESAAAYAQQLGFRPHRDYKKAARVFGGIKASDCDETFGFGREGKPFYFQGPGEDNETARKIINQLHRKCGEGGYHYFVEVSEAEEFLTTQVDLYLRRAEQGHLDEAFTKMRPLLKRYPESPEVLYGWALLLALDEDYPAAEDYFKRCLAINPDDDFAWYNLAINYQKLRNLPRMLAAMHKALQLADDEPEYWHHAQQIMSTGQRIADEYKLSLEDYIRSAELFQNGVDYMTERNFDQALEQFEASAKLNPRSHQCMGNIGTCHIQLGQVAKAKKALQSALEIEPSYEIARRNLELLEESEEGAASLSDKFLIVNSLDENDYGIIV